MANEALKRIALGGDWRLDERGATKGCRAEKTVDVEKAESLLRRCTARDGSSSVLSKRKETMKFETLAAVVVDSRWSENCFCREVRRKERERERGMSDCGKIG